MHSVPSTWCSFYVHHTTIGDNYEFFPLKQLQTPTSQQNYVVLIVRELAQHTKKKMWPFICSSQKDANPQFCGQLINGAGRYNHTYFLNFYLEDNWIKQKYFSKRLERHHIYVQKENQRAIVYFCQQLKSSHINCLYNLCWKCVSVTVNTRMEEYWHDGIGNVRRDLATHPSLRSITSIWATYPCQLSSLWCYRLIHWICHYIMMIIVQANSNCFHFPWELK